MGFKKCGLETIFAYCSEQACIQIDDNVFDDVENGTEYTVQLSCIGNVFEDNESYPIAERIRRGDDASDDHEPGYIPSAHLYSLRNNKLRGFNGRSLTLSGENI